MLLKRATILGKHTHLSDLLDKKLGASTGWERPPAMNTRLFGRRVERYTMSRADRRRHRRPCACPLPAGENTIDFQHRGASEGIFLKMVEDTRKPHFQLATGLWRFFSKPIARRVGYLLHREARRAPSKDQLRGGISGNPQTLPGGL